MATLGIKKGSNRAIAQNFLRSGIKEGLNNTQVYDQLRAGGLSYDKTAFSQDMQRLRAKPIYGVIPLQAMINQLDISGAPPLLYGKGKAKYMYKAMARTRNSRGQFNGGIVHWTVTSNVPLIPAVAAGIAVARTPDLTAEQYKALYPTDSMQVHPNDIYINPQPDYFGSNTPIP